MQIVRVTKGGGEDVSRPEIGARDEARNLSLGGVVAELTAACLSAVTALWPRVASPRAQQAGRRLCPGIRSGKQQIVRVHWARRNPRRKRTESTHSWGSQHWSVVGVEPPQPGVVNLRGAEFVNPREQPRSPCI